jgi:AcrR family transcriptional regulator
MVNKRSRASGVAKTVGNARPRANSRSTVQATSADLAPRAPRKHPSQERSQHTVAVIIEAAARVFDEEGLQATTNRIAELAGVSVGSLYQYFPDKLALITELHGRHLALVAQSVLGALDTTESQPLDAVVHRVVACSLAVHRQRPRLQRVLHAQLPQLSQRDDDSPAKQAVFDRTRQALQAQLKGAEPAMLLQAARTLLTLGETLVHDAVLHPQAEVDDAATANNIARVLCGYLDRLASPPRGA